MKRSLFVLLMVLSACGGTSVDTSTPEALHDSWITAVQDNDQEQLVALAPAFELTSARIDDVLPDGQLQGVDQVRVDGDMGYSIWNFDDEEWCFIGRMYQEGEEWHMANWRSFPMEQCTE